MSLKKLSWVPVAVLALGLVAVGARAQDSAQAQRINKLLASPDRSAETQAEDAGRKPLQVIEFLGIKSGDIVVDVLSGGGYYDGILSAAVGPEGKVYAQNSERALRRPGFAEAEQARVEKYGNIVPIHGDLPGGIAGKADAAFIGLNFHDIYNRGGDEAGQKILKGVYGTLKPGGVFGVTDHIGVEGANNAKMHRIPVEVVKAQLEKAGFTVEAESDLLRNSADDHSKAVFGPELHWKSDRMLILARKPM